MKKINQSIILIIISGSLFLSGCQTGQIKTGELEILAEFDIPVDAKHILLPVKFQGKEYQFALDTGTTGIVFDDSLKDKLGKRFLWPKTGSAARGRKIKVEYFQHPYAYLGPLRLKKYGLIAVCDLDQLLPKQNRTFDGIVGMEFLKKYIVQINFDQGQVRFLKGKKDFDLLSLFKPKENKHPEWGEPIPLKTKLFSELRYAKGSLLYEFTSNFLIDSGWSGMDALQSRLFEKVHSNIAIKPNSENMSSNTVFSNMSIKLIERFSVGIFEYKNNLFQKNNESILGLGFLSRHLVTFDFPNNMMYLKKGEQFDKPPSFSLQILDGRFDLSDGKLLASDIDPNSFAYKNGIRNNDIVTKIQVNEQVLTSFNAVEFMEFLTQLPMSEVRTYVYTFKRGDEIFSVSFTKR